MLMILVHFSATRRHYVMGNLEELGDTVKFCILRIINSKNVDYRYQLHLSLEKPHIQNHY